ncbi:hemerythrin domain-containing protein [bacterium]|nr:hemerythrin domain-containing protein [bacterium]
MATCIRQLTQERPWISRLLTAYGIDTNRPGPLPENPELHLHLRQIWNGPEGLRQLTPNELLDYIVHCHHRYLRKVLPQLIEQARTLNHPVLSELQALSQESKPHMFREEMEVFPAIREIYRENRPASHLPRWIARLDREHEQAFQRFLRIRQAMSETPSATFELKAALEALDEDMRWHMFAENELLFARILRSAS